MNAVTAIRTATELAENMINTSTSRRTPKDILEDNRDFFEKRFGQTLTDVVFRKLTAPSPRVTFLDGSGKAFDTDIETLALMEQLRAEGNLPGLEMVLDLGLAFGRVKQVFSRIKLTN
jgi:hypothetical protein